ncbi:hypothetical protein [Mesorhizobium sp. YM1C-6-2]|uniref:hypothetical protein n=1 Tax=Mesorhizobium sp. YM1C-6-2 TaxID=1827501 RepID=UPI001AED0BC5|nr:hypothetical protein [Mesorhizobium sp. YM1C-6-2]
MLRVTMETPAWKALSSTAQALYPWIKFEWRGPEANNNGKLRLSVRQAGEKLGVRPDTAAEAFRDLQRKGFIVQTEPGSLGVDGAARSPAYEITELKMPRTDGDGRKLYRSWEPGRDFPIAMSSANNPNGKNGHRTKTCHENRDGNVTKTVTNGSHAVTETVTPCHENRDEKGISQPQAVTESVTSLSYHTPTAVRGAARQPASKSGQAQSARTTAEARAAVNELVRATASSMSLSGGEAREDAA